MSDRAPRVSIGMPVYRKEGELIETLEAIEAQEFGDFEVILADNASDDGTFEICSQHARADSRIRVHRHGENIGSRRNFGFVFELARGEFFCWNRGHDVPAPDFLAKCVAALDVDPAAVLCHGRSFLRDRDGVEIAEIDEVLDTRRLSLPERLSFVWRHAVGPAGFGLMRRAAMQHTRFYQDISGCDLVFLVELAVQGAFVHEPRTWIALRRMREEGDELESVARTWAQLDPRRVRVEPPPLHVLQFLECHLSVVRELEAASETKDLLTSDLFGLFRDRYAGSLRRALDHVARRIDAACSAESHAACAPLDFASVLELQRRVTLGLVLIPDHDGAQRARELLTAVILEHAAPGAGRSESHSCQANCPESVW